MTARSPSICDRYQGKRLNSPNDVVVKSDGSIWFTDPLFGILGNYEGHVDTSELPMAVYRVDGATGAATIVADGIVAPNGLAFSPDEIDALHRRVARASRAASSPTTSSATAPSSPTAASSSTPSRTARRTASASTSTAICGAAGAWRAELDGVRVFNPAGEPIGHIALPERCANVCFGGRYRNRLFMAASHSVYSLYVNTQGVAGG